MRLSIGNVFLFACCLASAVAFTGQIAAGNTFKSPPLSTSVNLHVSVGDAENEEKKSGNVSRRHLFQRAATNAAAIASLASMCPSVSSAAMTGAADLPDLPPEAVRSYLQYRVPLQISADYYLWELRDKISRIDDWGEVNEVSTHAHTYTSLTSDLLIPVLYCNVRQCLLVLLLPAPSYPSSHCSFIVSTTTRARDSPVVSKGIILIPCAFCLSVCLPISQKK